MKIEILGTGCSKCEKLEQNAKKAVEELGIPADFLKVSEIEKIIEYGVMSTPALVINGEVKSFGKVLDVEKIKKLVE